MINIKNYRLLNILIITFIITLTACKTPTSPTSASENGYPISSEEESNELPGTTAYPVSTPESITEASILVDIPNPSPETGCVYGIVYSSTIEEPIPYTSTYMASKVPVEPGDDYVISIQEKSSPQFQTNSLGEFIIESIPPGEYVLIMVTPMATYPLLTEDGEQIELTINGGELVDLGAVYAQWPNFE